MSHIFYDAKGNLTDARDAGDAGAASDMRPPVGASTRDVSALVDAGLNEASTRLQALRTQQQLGVQPLSIANQSSQLILKLFQ